MNLLKKKPGTFRRQILDLLQEKYSYLYHGIVLDIGGRERGKFFKPKDKVKKWIFADIDPIHNPDIVLDISNMKDIESESINVINAIEVFEHVNGVSTALNECFRVLLKEGFLILSSPFQFHIHADPSDYQRWTVYKWKFELRKAGFEIKNIIIMGKFFTSLAESLKQLILAYKRANSKFFFILKLFLPIINLLLRYDNKKFVKNDKILNNYHNGYFIIAKKSK